MATAAKRRSVRTRGTRCRTDLVAESETAPISLLPDECLIEVLLSLDVPDLLNAAWVRLLPAMFALLF